MGVEAKLGVFRDRVIVDGQEYPVVRGRHGWRQVVDSRARAGRVRYDSWRDRVSIEVPRGSFEIRFRWRNTMFLWQGREYRIGSMIWDRLTITDAGRVIVDGKVTGSGVRFDAVGPEFRDIERELALGFGLRAQAFATAVIVGGAH